MAAPRMTFKEQVNELQDKIAEEQKVYNVLNAKLMRQGMKLGAKMLPKLWGSFSQWASAEISFDQLNQQAVQSIDQETKIDLETKLTEDEIKKIYKDALQKKADIEKLKWQLEQLKNEKSAAYQSISEKLRDAQAQLIILNQQKSALEATLLDTRQNLVSIESSIFSSTLTFEEIARLGEAKAVSDKLAETKAKIKEEGASNKILNPSNDFSAKVQAKGFQYWWTGVGLILGVVCSIYRAVKSCFVDTKEREECFEESDRTLKALNAEKKKLEADEKTISQLKQKEKTYKELSDQESKTLLSIDDLEKKIKKREEEIAPLQTKIDNLSNEKDVLRQDLALFGSSVNNRMFAMGADLNEDSPAARPRSASPCRMQ